MQQANINTNTNQRLNIFSLIAVVSTSYYSSLHLSRAFIPGYCPALERVAARKLIFIRGLLGTPSPSPASRALNAGVDTDTVGPPAMDRAPRTSTHRTVQRCPDSFQRTGPGHFAQRCSSGRVGLMQVTCQLEMR